MNKFLATTALTDYWRQDEESVLLGEWCRPNDYLAGSTDYEVLKYPWNDRAAAMAAYQFCGQLTDRLLGPLGDALGEIHGHERSLRGWRVVLAPWLYSFISTAYHRYICLDSARARYGNLTTLGPTLDSFCPASQDTLSYFLDYRKDFHNLQLFCQLAEHMDIEVIRRNPARHQLQSVQQISSESLYKNRTKLSAKTRLRHLMQDIIRPTLNLSLKSWGRHAQVILYKSALMRKEEIELALSSKLRIVPWITSSDTPVFQQTYNAQARNEIGQLLGAERFETNFEFSSLVRKLIPANLPFSMVENYVLTLANAKKEFPRGPRIIASAVGWITDDRFKLWAADAIETGAKLVGMQHGGAYGMRAMPALSEYIELAMLDKFISWGWEREKSPVIPAGTPKHFFTPKRSITTKATAEKPAMFVGSSCYRFPNQFASEPSGPLFLEYIDAQRRFLATLPAGLRKRILVRLQPEDLGWKNEERLLGALNDINIDRQHKFDELLDSAKLVIVDNLNTTMFQSLGRNIPTVLFWNKNHWGTNDEASCQLNLLASAGIYYETPEDAARHVIKVIDSPEEWWFAEATQSAVSDFLALYMRREDGWQQEWIQLFDGILACQQETGHSSMNTAININKTNS